MRGNRRKPFFCTLWFFHNIFFALLFTDSVPFRNFFGLFAASADKAKGME